MVAVVTAPARLGVEDRAVFSNLQKVIWMFRRTVWSFDGRMCQDKEFLPAMSWTMDVGLAYSKGT